MSLDMVSFDAALKEHYTDDRVENMVYMDNPLLALMAKMEDFGGRNLPVPIIWGILRTDLLPSPRQLANLLLPRSMPSL